jgi:hypothetical protein
VDRAINQRKPKQTTELGSVLALGGLTLVVGLVAWRTLKLSRGTLNQVPLGKPSEQREVEAHARAQARGNRSGGSSVAAGPQSHRPRRATLCIRQHWRTNTTPCMPASVQCTYDATTSHYSEYSVLQATTGQMVYPAAPVYECNSVLSSLCGMHIRCSHKPLQ